MHTIKSLSIIALAAYLIFQGLYYLAELSTPVVHAAIGLLGLASGILMFISLNHWVEHHKGK
ncbi:MAG: hypothetical protein PVI40_04950 [Chlamydiota bacterium]|jgi:hypothetical protein|nr:MAG: hypothetical protein COT84_06130 [Chlamydiae bacterium CG10_big_fil_rev_8_21_14_0_10_35_9]